MPSLGPFELIIILVIIVIVFGVGKLPQIGGALGQGIREFRHANKDATQESTASQPAANSEEKKS